MRQTNLALFLQITGWSLLALLIFFERAEVYRNFLLAFISTINSVLSIAFIIYGYIFYVYPKYYTQKNIIHFAIITVVFLIIALVVRNIIPLLIIDPIAGSDAARPRLVTEIITIFVAFIISLLLLHFVEDMRKQKLQIEIKIKQKDDEMKWLKAQVQPHFLFNALNNIYYEAQENSKNTPDLIEKLAQMMRYLLEETKKEKVPLYREIEFIKNYIVFENLRLHNKVPVHFTNNALDNLMIPPLLLLPLVENVFKHGIEKNKQDNYAKIKLSMDESYLNFEIVNRKNEQFENVEKKGFGLENLSQRLQILFGQNFILRAENNDDHFESTVKFPV